MASLGQICQRAPISPDVLEAALLKSITFTAPDLSIWQNVVPVLGTSPLSEYGVSIDSIQTMVQNGPERCIVLVLFYAQSLDCGGI